MKNGRTIAAEREKVISDSERQRNRKRAQAKTIIRAIVAVIFAAGLIFLAVSGVLALIEVLQEKSARNDNGNEYVSSAEIVDEAETGVTDSVKTFVANIEEDLAEYGYKVLRAVLPVGKMRQVNLYLEGVNGYFKVNRDRETGAQAEDIDRMIRYLQGQGIDSFEYVDVRIERKGYYK